MSENVEKFIRVFESLRTEVNRRAGDASLDTFGLDRASDKDGLVRKNRELLKYVRDVRNLLQHPKHSSKGHAVEISDAFLAEVEALLHWLRNPPTASSTGVPRKEIKSAGESDLLGNLADSMRNLGFSHLPILDQSDVVIGVFNEAAVFDYLWAEPETILGRQMALSEILDYCRLDADRTEIFKFVSPRTPLDDLVAMFLGVASPTTRVGAIFVTASGKESEPLQRLITPWDVLATSAAS